MVTTRSAERKAASASRVTELALRSRSIRPASAASTPSRSPRKRPSSVPNSPVSRAKRARVGGTDGVTEVEDPTMVGVQGHSGGSAGDSGSEMIVVAMSADVAPVISGTEIEVKAAPTRSGGRPQTPELLVRLGDVGDESSEDDGGAPVVEAATVIKKTSTPRGSRGRAKGRSVTTEEVTGVVENSSLGDVGPESVVVDVGPIQILHEVLEDCSGADRTSDGFMGQEASKERKPGLVEALQLLDREEKVGGLASQQPPQFSSGRMKPPTKSELQRATPRQAKLPAKPQSSLSAFRAEMQGWRRVNRLPMRWEGKRARFTAVV